MVARAAIAISRTRFWLLQIGKQVNEEESAQTVLFEFDFEQQGAFGFYATPATCSTSGETFWFIWKKFVGSYFFFRATNRW